MVEKACMNCRAVTEGDVCPFCQDSELTKTFEGYILITKVGGSEVAKAINAKVHGKYALKIKR
ncbi:MAG: transcription elongation factor subunit Spt4 [Candidatus Micrarchaeota archaeon]